MGTGRAAELWPVLLLLIVVVVPTIGVLWFVRVAMENEQLASRQRLTNAYRTQLQFVRRQLNAYWTELAAESDRRGASVSLASQFAEVVTSGTADAVVFYDDDGNLLYPTQQLHDVPLENPDSAWGDAERLEHKEYDVVCASRVYLQIARHTRDTDEEARALQAHVRCLLKSNRPVTAIEFVTTAFHKRSLDEARDGNGRQVVPNVELMALRHINANESKEFKTIQKRLVERLTDYDNGLPPAQRLFLMKELTELIPDPDAFPTMAGAELAAQFAAAHPLPSRDTVLQRSQLPGGVWQIASPSRRAVLLFRTETIADTLSRTMAEHGFTENNPANVRLIVPGRVAEEPELITIPAGPQLPGWRLSLAVHNAQSFDSAVAQKNAVYLWTSFLVVLSTLLIALAIAGTFRRQIRIANLKNDLVGTVSHELKTPLASMRLLVDTLIAADTFDESQVREYLNLIAKENTRLSRLIDSFLTFSRMERGKYAFDFGFVDPVFVVERTMEAAGERFRQADCVLNAEIERDLPNVFGDADALITVLLNLLDNAYKYATGHREITLHAFARDQNVCLSVEDNGIGLSRASTRKIFHRFYQVDQSLVRLGHGCGLGLSIVEHIVKVHGGHVEVDSKLGHGSRFTVVLPKSARRAECDSGVPA